MLLSADVNPFAMEFEPFLMFEKVKANNENCWDDFAENLFDDTREKKTKKILKII